MDRKLVNLLEQGFSYQQQGNTKQATACYLAVLKADEQNQFALNLLGVIAIEQQQYEQAIGFLKKALESNDKDHDTHTNLGLAYTELKELEPAKQSFIQSLNLNPEQPVVLNNLGNIFASLNEHQQACNCFDAALKMDNRYLDCLNNLSLSLKELGLLDKALIVLKHAINIAPSKSGAYNNKGEVLNKKGDYQEAVIYFQKAIEIDSNIVAKVNLSTALKQLGQTKKAKQTLLEVLVQEPDNTEANNHLGVLFEQLGEFDLAAKYFRLALAHTPNHASSFYQLSKLKNQRLTEQEFTRLKQAVQNDGLIDLFKSSLWLALGCEYEKQKNYTKSMQCFIDGKRLKAKQTPYNKDATVHYQLACEKVFTSELYARTNKTCHDDLPKPIFVVGMPRSGTTLTEQILASHSQIVGAGELGFINDIAADAADITQKPFPFCVAFLTAAQKSKLRISYLNKIVERFGYSEYVVDKNPLNYNFIGLIVAIFPEANIIYCKRDAMDNCTSIFKLPFDDNQSYSHDLSALGHYYRAHQGVMKYWQELFSDKILTVEYESTVENLEHQAKRLLAFIGVNFEQGVLEFHQNTRIVMTPSAEQVRQPIYKSSINAWQRYGDLLEPLQLALNYQVQQQERS